MKHLKRYRDWTIDESNNWNLIKKEFGEVKSKVLRDINKDRINLLQSSLSHIIFTEIYESFEKNFVEIFDRLGGKQGYQKNDLPAIKKLVLQGFRELKTTGEIKSLRGAFFRKLASKITMPPLRMTVQGTHLAFKFDTKHISILSGVHMTVFPGMADTLLVFSETHSSYDIMATRDMSIYWTHGYKIRDLPYTKTIKFNFTKEVHDFINGKSKNYDIDSFLTNKDLENFKFFIEKQFFFKMFYEIYQVFYTKEKYEIQPKSYSTTGSVGSPSSLSSSQKDDERNLDLYSLRRAEYWLRVLVEKKDFFEKFKDKFKSLNSQENLPLTCHFHSRDIEDMKLNARGKYSNLENWFSLTLSIVSNYLKLFPDEKNQVYEHYFQVFENIVAVYNIAKDKQYELDAICQFIEFYKKYFPELCKLAIDKIDLDKIESTSLNWIRSNYSDVYEMIKQKTKKEDQWATDLQADAGEYGL